MLIRLIVSTIFEDLLFIHIWLGPKASEGRTWTIGACGRRCSKEDSNEAMTMLMSSYLPIMR